MRIRKVAELIAQCWTSAEQALRDTVREKSPDRNEEFITDLFHSELEAECKRISATGAVERAFKNDLRLALPTIGEIDAGRITRGLVATVHFHPKEIEGRTGGDYGLAFIRPDVRYANYSRSSLNIEHDYRRGLLCQAKILRRNSSWGKPTSKQLQLMEHRLQYLSLVLYKYADQRGARRELCPFQWQLTCNGSAADIVGWLRSGSFPNLQSSKDILLELADGNIGTDDDQLISEFVAPRVRPSLEIKIHWGDGTGPGPTVQLHNSTLAVKQQVFLRR
jgi:hypothetical protein